MRARAVLTVRDPLWGRRSAGKPGMLVGPDRKTLTFLRLCANVVDVTRMSGAGIMLMSGEIPQGSLLHHRQAKRSQWRPSSPSEKGHASMRIRATVRCWNRTFRIRRFDVGRRSPSEHWKAGVCAVFGFPLQVGAVRLGALNPYRDRPGALSD